MPKLKVTHSYQRYNLEECFGIINNNKSGLFYFYSKNAKFPKAFISGTGEFSTVWNMRTSEKIHVFKKEGQSNFISCLAVDNGKDNTETKVAVGYSDGWVYIFSTINEEPEVQFRAGRSAVTSMDLENEILDSEINAFDLVSSVGLRMKGHKGIITKLKLLYDTEMLISSAQDSFIKFWDLKTQHCFATLTGHPGPVWDFALTDNNKILVSGASDSQLRIWRLNYFDQVNNENLEFGSVSTLTEKIVTPLSQIQMRIQAEFLGCVQRLGRRRIQSLKFDPSGKYLFCQCFERKIEVFRLLDSEAKSKRLKKKIKKANAKGESTDGITLDISDELRSILSVDLPCKPTGCDVLAARLWINSSLEYDRVRFICGLVNNSVEEMELVIPKGVFKFRTLKPISLNSSNTYPSVRIVNSVSNLGHRSTPIACSFTSDNMGLFTLSRSEAKLWSKRTMACLATLKWGLYPSHKNVSMDIDNQGHVNEIALKASAMVLAPGDRHVIIGFESGHLFLYDLNSRQVIQSVDDAHEGAVRSIVLTGDKKGILSGGSDKRIRFYIFDVKCLENGASLLNLVESQRAKTVADQISCLAMSPNNRLIVVAMMNFHVDVFFADSFKRIHSLYGHAAPVTSLDISSDNRLIITGSVDKCVRLWELQFGNCQKRFTSHLEPVTCVRFIPHTLLAVSSDQGGQIKQWDVKKFYEITTLKGHSGGVTCLAATITNTALMAKKMKEEASVLTGGAKSKKSSNEEDDDFDDELCGGLILSVGHDFGLRIWSEVDELLVLEEELRLAREKEEEEDQLVRSEVIVPGSMPNEASEIGTLGRPTGDRVDAADTLMQAIDIYQTEMAKLKSNSKHKAPLHPLMTALGTTCPERFLLKSLMRLRAPHSCLGGGGAGLEYALGLITTEHARLLLDRLTDWMSRGWELELVGRAIRHLTVLHFNLVRSSEDLGIRIKQSHQARTEQMACVKIVTHVVRYNWDSLANERMRTVRILKSIRTPYVVVGPRKIILTKNQAPLSIFCEQWRHHKDAYICCVYWNLLGMNMAGLRFLTRKVEEDQNIVLFDKALIDRDKRVKNRKAKKARMALVIPG